MSTTNLMSPTSLRPGVYRLRSGYIVRVKDDDEIYSKYPLVDADVSYRRWTRDGHWNTWDKRHDNDLVERLKIEEYPEYYI